MTDIPTGGPERRREPPERPESDDAALAAELAEALASDPVPAAVLDAAAAAWTWRRIDAELAELLADEDALALRAGTGTPVLLAFGAGDVVVDVERVTGAASGGTDAVVGQLTVPAGTEVRSLSVEAAGGGRIVVLPAGVDATGGFRVEVPLEALAVRLVLVVEPGGTIVTPWS